MSQVSGHISNPFEALFYLRRISEGGANAPPNPRNATRQSHVIRQFCKNNRISLRVEEGKHKGQPLPGGSHRNVQLRA